MSPSSMQEGIGTPGHKVPMLLGHERRYWQKRGLHNIWLLSIYGCLVIFDKGLGLGAEIQQMQPEFYIHLHGYHLNITMRQPLRLVSGTCVYFWWDCKYRLAE
jgi:hypothetical protein